MLPALQQLSGPFNFLGRSSEELRRLVPDAEQILPAQQKIFQEDETATPLIGYPVLLTPELAALDRAFDGYLAQEEEVEYATLQRIAFDSSAFGGAWERYRLLLTRATENSITASYGRSFPGIFWLYHSGAIARGFKETTKRLLRRDLVWAKSNGDEFRYRVYHRALDRLSNLTYDLVNRLSTDTEEVEQQIFPILLTRMKDNILIFTEDHISPNLAELASYFSGCLKLDGRDFRLRLMRVHEWYSELLRHDRELVQLSRLLGEEPGQEPRLHLNRPGYLTFLAGRPTYDPEILLPPAWIQVWESLLVKLKEFELFNALRRSIVGVDRDGDHVLGRERFSARVTGATTPLPLSSSTRPLDFMAPWVVDPLVARFGLIYDISDFTETVSLLRRSGALEQDRSFRMLFRFQRRVNRLASQQKAKLEKYLGDGAFYSSREAHHLLVLAMQIQRAYREALAKGFPFSNGLRIALNHGQYRLLPIQIGGKEEGGDRYEFFGHGVVELTRLTSGKASREIDEIKTLLITLGYPEPVVNRFFAPMTHQNLDVVNKLEESRSFYSYINPNGSLVNEGIVATLDFIQRLEKESVSSRIFRLLDGERTYVALKVDTPGGSLLVGIRKLGVAHLKGLDRLPVYEIVDASLWGDNTLVELRGSLMELIEREFNSALSH
ncbi:MAG: Guanylate cyclase protein [Acidobacteriota bacterium]|nr:Guanylate cyclase protein [Acidobacteriota bacterium]